MSEYVDVFKKAEVTHFYFNIPHSILTSYTITLKIPFLPQKVIRNKTLLILMLNLNHSLKICWNCHHWNSRSHSRYQSRYLNLSHCQTSYLSHCNLMRIKTHYASFSWQPFCKIHLCTPRFWCCLL